MRQIKEKAPAAPASVTSANHNNHNQDITNSARVQEVIAAIINNCNKYREYGRRRSPHNFFSSLNCESTESDIKKSLSRYAGSGSTRIQLGSFRPKNCLRLL